MRLFGAMLAVMVLVSTAAQARQSTLALEGAFVSVSTADLSGVSPTGSGLQHDVSVGGSDPAYGLSFETRLTRHVGLRAGALWGVVPLRARMVCPTPTCDFTSGSARVSIDGGERRVEDDGDLRFLFLEVPILFQPRPDFDVFAGPTIAFAELDGVTAPGTSGLTLDVDTSSPSYGLHLGGVVHFGGRRGPGRSEPAWTVGVIARWIPIDLELAASLPLLPSAGTLFSGEAEEDLVSVSLVVGRRFGRSSR